MSNTSNIQLAIYDAIAKLSAYQQQLLLLFIESMQAQKDPSGTRLLTFAGSISTADLRLMETTIQKDCENIDTDEW